MKQKSIPGGGPAFPRAGFSGPEGFGRPENGMTLRDYFAAKAMREADWGANPAEACAEWAYKVADAMLAAR